MLIRVFRVTDKFSNAGLKFAVWLAGGLLEQVTYLKESIASLLEALWAAITALSGGLVKSTQRLSKEASDKAAKVYQVTDERRRAMAQRAAMIAARAEPGPPAHAQETVVEDPLMTQNRMLSAFTVLLMVALIAILLWATGRDGDNGNSGFAGALPQNTANATLDRLPSPNPSTTPAPVVFANWQGTLVFSVRDAGQEDLFVLQRGDVSPRRITNDPADDRDPAWSPDGRTIAFTSKRDGPWELYTMDVVTRQITRLTTSQDFVGAPTWSPDGTFLAYEGYNQETQNLDIYIVAVDRSQGPIQLTYNPGPDIEPAWMPDTGGSSGGRLIAYTSIRNGRQDIYVIDLDNPDEGAALNLTNTADFLENHPAWSPDGRRITYSAVVNGIESIYIRSLATPSDVQIVGRGSMPVWNPVDGSSIFYSQRLPGKQSAISGGLPGSFGSSSAENLVNGIVADLDWTPAEPSITAVVADYPPVPPVVDIEPDADGLYSLAVLQSVEAPEPYLNARVYPAFNALRFKMLDVAGLDFLSTLEDAFWDLSRSPELGQQRESWHYAGRAFAIPRGLVSQGNPTPIVVVREEGEIGTYWRVYVRVAEQAQGGALGEPLRQTPWDFDARTSGDPEAFEQGGKLMDTVPSGYYVDFTQLAADHGWERLPADRRWRQNFPDVLFWVFIKRDNLDWETAMQELYTDEQLRRFLNDEPVETTPLPTTSPEEGTTEAPAETIEATSTPAPTETLPFRTSTPIPPDILER